MGKEHNGRSPSVTALGPLQLVQFGQNRAEKVLDLQKDLLDACDEANRDWITRLRSEVRLWSEFATKLAMAQTIPEVAEAYGECLSHRAQLVAEDGQRLFAEGQKIVDTVTSVMSSSSRIENSKESSGSSIV